ncbi:MAG TPA: hypothetical protein VNC41_08800 [Acidimicrobiia bacterium]|nr:hypothetical protein [Acidimicrobiia bacterium]
MTLSFDQLVPGTDLGELALTVSPAANERYWRAAGADHPLLVAGALYPPIAANLTVLLFNEACPVPVIQTRQVLRTHRRADAGVELHTTGAIIDAYEKRGRAYVDIEAVVTTADARDQPLWTSMVSFTPVATLNRP